MSSPTPTKPEPTPDVSLPSCIVRMIREQKGLYLEVFVCLIGGVIAGGSFPAQAFIMSRLIHVFTPMGGGQSAADFWALMLFVLAIANLIAYSSIGVTNNKIAQSITRRYRKEMFDSMLNMDPSFFDLPEHSSGALTSKLSSVPDAIIELMSNNLVLVAILVVNILGCSILAIATGWKLGLVIVFGGMPLLVGAGALRMRLEARIESDTNEKFAESAALATEAVTSIRTVASLTMEGQIIDKYGEVLDHIANRFMRNTAWTMLAYAASQSLEFLVMALGFWYGSRLLSTGEYTSTQFFTIFIAVIFGGAAAGQFSGLTSTFVKAGPAANYLFWLRSQEPKIREDETNVDTGPSNDDGAIDVEGVEFNYSQRESTPVLRGLNVNVPSGSYIACVGPSGCGKSTLVSLLERYYDPTSGQITLASTDISTFSPRLYRAHMSLVQQEPTLYQGSIYENVSLGLDYEPSNEQVLEALRQANVLDLVTSLPEGLSTACGSKGLSFSGGQRQRIAIARALIRGPRVLLLDEATSALDTQSERVVQKTLDQAARSQSRTTVAVAHRLSTIRHADQIFVFGNGRVVEWGTHSELQASRGIYFEMCLAQSLDDNEAS